MQKRVGSLRGATTLLLGHAFPPPAAMGFAASRSGRRLGDAVTYAGDGHLLSVAPTRSGKGVGPIICNLLRYRGPTVVTDMKSENWAVTHAARRRMGQRIVRLAPFLPTTERDSFNPFEIVDLIGCDLESAAQMMASWFAGGNQSAKEPFWDLSGTALLAGAIAYACSQEDRGRRNLATVVDLLFGDDVPYKLAVLLDVEGKSIPPLAYREFASFLSTAEVTRSGILATAQAYLKPLLSEATLKSLSQSTFSLPDFVAGAPMTIYIGIPPAQIHSHIALMKLWIGALLCAVMSRTARPELNTLFLLDEVGQFGYFSPLESLVTLVAGYGAWAWLFLQDLAQLQGSYPHSWQTILNNCGVIQAFGFNNRRMASQWADYFDHSPAQLRDIKGDRQVVLVQGRGELICRRPNYLTDKAFHGLYQSNPLFCGYSLASKQHSQSNPGDDRVP